MNKKTLSFFNFCHQWIGLIGGWFLFIIFISGSISIFDKEITQWMQPELALYTPTKEVSAQALDQAYTSWKQHQNIRKNLITLPSSRDPFIRVLHYQNNLLQGVVINPQKGNIIPVRATGGGYFIDSLHNSLFSGRMIGGAIVLIIGIAFILILVSGVIIYLPSMIKKAFFIYPKPRSLRFKSDLHTIIGFFFLPFLFITAISGILFLAPRFLPETQIRTPVPTKQHQQHNLKTIPDLPALLIKAKSYFGNMPSTITFSKNDVRFFENEQARIAHLKNYVAFNRYTMQITSSQKTPALLPYLNKILLGIHMARAGDIVLRGVFFLMGIGSALLVACGLLFYSTKKRNSIISEASLLKQYFYKSIEGINIGIIMGTLIAMILYLWLNRLVPVISTYRISLEIIGVFASLFIILSMSILVSIFFRGYYAWISLLGLLSALCLLLPFLDILTCYAYLKAAIFNQNYLYITIDGIIFILGCTSLRLFFYVLNKRAKEC